MNKTWSFYDAATGIFTGRRLRTSNADTLAANTPEGCAAIEGRFDPQTERVDLETGGVIGYQAPNRRKERDRAHARIVALERSLIRPMRELLLDPSNAEARRRVEAIDQKIAELRPLLTRPDKS